MRIGVLLTGCGRLDGSDVHEAVLTLLAIQREGHAPVCMAPAGDQAAVADHASAELDRPQPGRNMQQEAARLAAGTVRLLEEVPAGMLDGVIIPGGAGAPRSLCEPGAMGIGGGPLKPEVRAILEQVLARGCRVGAVGLAGVVLDRLLDRELRPGPADLPADALEVASDGRSAYCPGMLAAGSLAEVAEGIDRMVGWVSGGGA